MKRIALIAALAAISIPAAAQQAKPPTVEQLIHAAAISCQNEKNADQQTILQLIQQSDTFSAEIAGLQKQIADLKAADKKRDDDAAKKAKESKIEKPGNTAPAWYPPLQKKPSSTR